MKNILFHTCFYLILTINLCFAQTIKQPETPTFNNGFNQAGTGSTNYGTPNSTNKVDTRSDYHNSNVIETNKSFNSSYKAPTVNVAQNNQTVKILDLYKEADLKSNDLVKKQLWELKLRSFKFANPNTELFKKLQPFYDAAFDSINQILSCSRPLDLKKAVFLLENAYLKKNNC